MFQVQQDQSVFRMLLSKKQYGQLHSEAKTTKDDSGIVRTAISIVGLVLAVFLLGLLGLVLVGAAGRVAFRVFGLGVGNKRGMPAAGVDGRYEQIWQLGQNGLNFADQSGPVSIPWTSLSACLLSEKQITIRQRNGGTYRFRTDTFPPAFLIQLVEQCRAAGLKTKKGGGRNLTPLLLVFSLFAVALAAVTLLGTSSRDQIVQCPNGTYTVVNTDGIANCP